MCGRQRGIGASVPSLAAGEADPHYAANGENMRLTRSPRALLCALIALFGAAGVVAKPAAPAAASVGAVPQPRARDLGIPFDGTPGPLNAITDVAGVLVGHTTLISGAGKLKVGRGPVRTGVTAVLPRGSTRSRIRSSRLGSRRMATAK